MKNYIESHIEVGEPGETIILYEGMLEVHLDSESYIIDSGKIIFVFLPKPRVEFHLTDADSLVMKLLRDIVNCFKIKLPWRNVFVEAAAISKSTINSRIIAIQTRKIEYNLDNKISQITFYLPNFLEILSPIKLITQEWQIIINLLNDNSKIRNFLKYSENFAVTHICRIENTQSKIFDIDVADDLTEAIYYFLSFIRGLWIAPILMYGFDEDGNKIWESLEHNVDNWQFTRSWLPLTKSDSIEHAFSGFWDKWKDDRWKEIIKLSIYWYVAVSKQSGGGEGSIILTQAALEMLANVVLVEDKNIVSSSGFEKLEAKDKISLLLNQCSIPLEVPSTLNELSKYAKEFNYSGTQAITELRNRLIHPKLKNREKFLNLPSGIISETYLLGKWYLELVILYLLNYQDKYINHTKSQPYLYHDGEPVPWINVNV